MTSVGGARGRAFIAWLNLIEPLARDWGRLTGGLTPWRSVMPRAGNGIRLSRSWRLAQPFRRDIKWVRRGGPSLDKYPFLDHLSRHLIAQGWAVGWNPASRDWDLKVRRGELGR